MNYKVIIDPYRGGSEVGFSGNGIDEAEYNLKLSLEIYDILRKNGVSVKLTRDNDKNLSLDERISIINSSFDMNDEVLVFSNRLNSGSNGGFEIVYALRNSSALASKISNELSSAGFTVNKYYQMRSELDTMEDADLIIRETAPDQSLIIYYGYVGNSNDANIIKNDYKKIAQVIADAIMSFIGVSNNESFYIVQKGDTLYSISKKYNVTVDELKKINNLVTNTLMIGQRIILPTNDNSYTVVKGDSLYKIAKMFNTTVDDIKELNNLTNNLLSIGQVLKIPSGNYTTYEVVKGDSLYKIAKIFNTTVDKISKQNGLTSSNLSIGQILKIPV